MFMIFNVGSNSNPAITADTVEYGDSNVGAALGDLTNSINTLESKDTALTNSINTLTSKDTELTNSINSLATRATTLENELTANGKRIYLDYKDGKYGYNTSAGRGADTFSPFKSGGGDEDFNVLTTKTGISGLDLGTIYGNGYLVLRKTWGTDGQTLSIYIDGNTSPFTVKMYGESSGTANVLRFYFQESIRFVPNNNHQYFYQTLLTNKVLPKRYSIIQGVNEKGVAFSFTGKGKIILCSEVTGAKYTAVMDGESFEIPLNGQHCMDLYFTKSFKCTSGYTLYYVAYLEI